MSEVNHSLHLHEFKILLFYLEIQLMYAKLSRKLEYGAPAEIRHSLP